MERKEGQRYKIRRTTGGIREGVNMEKDGDSEEDNDEEVVKHVLKRRFEGRGQKRRSDKGKRGGKQQ